MLMKSTIAALLWILGSLASPTITMASNSNLRGGNDVARMKYPVKLHPEAEDAVTDDRKLYQDSYDGTQNRKLQFDPPLPTFPPYLIDDDIIPDSSDMTMSPFPDTWDSEDSH